MQLLVGAVFSLVGVYFCTWHQDELTALGVLCLIWGNNHISAWYEDRE